MYVLAHFAVLVCVLQRHAYQVSELTVFYASFCLIYISRAIGS